MTRKRQTIGKFCALIMLAMIGGWFAPHPPSVQAQEMTFTSTFRPRRNTPTATATPLPVTAAWSAPQLLFTSREDIQTPFLSADNQGHLHLFWKIRGATTAQGGQEPDLLYYSQWNGSSWTAPVDVQADTTVLSPTAVVDQTGIIHLFWSGANGRLMYSRAAVEVAMHPAQWSKPQAFDMMNFAAHPAVDSQNVLYVVYGGNQARGVYLMSSRDGGAHWSSAVNIHPTDRLNTSAEYPRLAISPAGVLHVVWTEYQLPSGWPPTGIFYTRSNDGGQTWSQAEQITQENFDQANIAVVSEQEIHIVYNAIVTIGGRYHRWSADGGESWSKRSVLTDRGGTEGAPQLAVDSIRRLHVLTTYGGCAYHYTWEAAAWSDGVCLAKTLRLTTDPAPVPLVEEPALAITRGRYLHAVFFSDRKQLWYSSIELLNALTTSLTGFQPRSTPTTTPQLGSTTQVVAPSATPVPAAVLEGEIERRNPLDRLAVDLLPALLVLTAGAGGILFARALRQRGNR